MGLFQGSRVTPAAGIMGRGGFWPCARHMRKSDHSPLDKINDLRGRPFWNSLSILGLLENRKGEKSLKS